MRVLVKNPEGCYEIVLIDRATIEISKFVLCLRRSDKHGQIRIYTDSQFVSHAVLNELLTSGYADLSMHYAEYDTLD